MEERDLIKKQQIIERLKELAESENLGSTLVEIANLKKQWRRSSYDESMLEKELEDEFEKYLAVINERQGEIMLSAEEAKKDVIEQSKKVLEMTNFKNATAKMNELMALWKAAGSLDKEKDDELWAQFKEVRDAFFAKRKEYYAQLHESFAVNKEKKEALIEAIKEVGQMENIKEANQKVDDLMNEWKAVGSAGRENDEPLWHAFNDERRAFFKKKNQYYSELRASYNQKAEAKRQLIAQAKKCLAFSEYTEEEVATMKDLRRQWKEIGSAGRDNEETLWNEFNDILNTYYENMKYYG